MFNLSVFGRLLVLLGIMLIVIGLVLIVAGKLPLRTIPGDIVIKRPNFVVYIPIVSALLISLILTVIVNLFLGRWR